MSEPLIVGIRHHSPACARLVKSLIESQRPRYVLIEGPADFNDRVDELFLAHQLPVAIYSYCQYQDGAAPGRGAWTPFAEFSPEWQALQAARRIQAQTYFIDLPCWAQSEEEDDSPDTQDESQTLLLRATRMDNSDTLWDHLFEDESQQTALPSTLAHQVLEHYQLTQLPVSALQMLLHCPPQAIAHHQQLEQQALASLQHWGVFHV